MSDFLPTLLVLLLLCFWCDADIKHRRRRANCFPSSTRLITMAPKETTPLVKQSAADEENFAKLKAYQP
jgi:hypothetical protein